MIAIPNMEKPKGCWDCFNYDCDHWGEHGYDNSTDCPLIELPQEERAMSLIRDYIALIDGERRADEK